MHGHDGGHLFEHVRVSFVICNNKGSGCKQINVKCHNKVQSKKSVGYVIKSNSKLSNVSLLY